MAKDKTLVRPTYGIHSGFLSPSDVTGYSNTLMPHQAHIFGQNSAQTYQIYDDIARDGRVSSALAKRKQKLVGREWQINAPINASAKEKKAAEWIKEHLSSVSFDKICLDLLDAIHYGIAYSEIIWAYDGEHVVIEAVKPRERERFMFDKDGRLRLIKNTWDQTGEVMPERKFVTHRFRNNDTHIYGLGLGYELFWPSQFKRRGVGFWQRFLDKWANPIPVGKVLPGTSEQQRGQLVKYLQGVNNARSLVINVGEEIETYESSRSGRAEYEPWKKAWDEEISLIILGETLTSSVGSHGSYAAAKTHSDILDDLVDMDSDLLAGTLNETLVTWLTEFNFAGCRPPRIWWELPADELAEEELAIKRAERRMVELELFEKQQSLGFTPVDQNWINISQGQKMKIGGFSPQSSHTLGAKKKDLTYSADTVGALPAHDLLADLFADHFKSVFSALRAKFEHVSDLEAFYLEAATVTGQVKTDLLAEHFGDALALDYSLGRAEVLDELDDEASFADVDYEALPFKEQLTFFRNKVNLPSNDWTDVMRHAHDRAFVIAGANTLGIVEDFRAAIDKAIVSGTTLQEFQSDFDSIAQKHGWDYNGEADWRARTIYETNMRTSYMAGRFDQMSHPDVTARRPYWQYIHGETRVPKIPRKSHRSWHGLVLRHDDPWWQKHYPPNDWRCSCGVRTLSDADLARTGKTQADVAPNLGLRTEKVRQTGEVVQVPNGVGLGWDYAPGRTWSQGLVPKELQEQLSLPPKVVVNKTPISSLAKPFTSERLADNLSDEDYARAFLTPFGADIGRGVLFRDKAGQIVTITDDLLRSADGDLKVNKFGRGQYMAQLAESIYDPDEIWINWQYDERLQKWLLVRNYLRTSPNDAGFAALSWRDGLFWFGNTAFSPRTRGKVQMSYFEKRRQGALLYRRQK